MVFSSPIFIFIFFPTCLLAYFISRLFRNIKIGNICLLVFSILFYSYGGFSFILFMVLSIVLNYYAAIYFDKLDKNDKIRQKIFIATIIFNLFLLFIFKYFNLFVDTFFNTISIFSKSDIKNTLPKVLLPIGISFYTFQILSYVIDVYNKKIKSNNNILDLALYAFLFPQLIAGPIVRYDTVESELKNRFANLDDIYVGARRFAVGFIKKVLLANYIGYIADTTFNATPYHTGFYYTIIAILCFVMQVYLDFYGYSDMAIGIGRIFGFHFPENFNQPFLSNSLTEFWKRWHITLTSFFRDYLYIPLGGNRKGMLRTCINIFIVFSLSGFWHGASFNFLFWGMYNALFLIIERLFLKKYLDRFPKFIGIIYTIIIWSFGMILFYFEDLSKIGPFLTTIFHEELLILENRGLIETLYNPYFVMVFVASILCSTPFFDYFDKKMAEKNLIFITDLIIILLFIYAIMDMIASGYNPFIYFRF